jgi:hypothetical protein
MNSLSLEKHIDILNDFMNKTSQYAMKEPQPGGYYKAIWMRDASYILKDQFISGYTFDVIDDLIHIWSNQINDIQDKKIIFGRGSPITKFTPMRCNPNLINKFKGALPTTIYENFLEIYASNPDIDSTALMIYVTSWIISRIYEYINLDRNDNIYPLYFSKKKDFDLELEFSKIVSFFIPKMLDAIQYLYMRDIDSDSLLEQESNEDWMDTALRKGKIVYSQGCWLLALKNFNILLKYLNIDDTALYIDKLANNVINAVEKHMWSEQKTCFIDNNIGSYSNTNCEKIMTQDSLLYLFALINDNFPSLSNCEINKDNGDINYCSTIFHNKSSLERYNRMLDTLKEEIWKHKFPMIIEKPLQKTGPWPLKPNYYHNYTFWPWITGIELMTRLRFRRLNECDYLISTLFLDEFSKENLLYEWINPITNKGNGAYPFRTGISSLRLVIYDVFRILRNNNRNKTTISTK